ncbi:capsular biosynthesis protein [Halomonas sp. DP8Y7-3]|uniref:capsule biosynthesis protein n=1 Tax=Halomonas sp. DP8Y7-3 TaxID=2859079 RepID=UPI001C94F06D|nr:capsular biosynthesis protein [Halomonas sp. DP8Y7-3]MBY5928649.1 capsular biosynthesis protein [Halomonas sp. DP8Y7-3]MED5295522.1 capsular biosynthesis protein [Pseudomonadota bacterium]
MTLLRTRQFLLLQGPCSPFFTQLSRELLERGHGVHLIDLCGGDLIYRWRLGSRRFRGGLTDFTSQIATWMSQWRITDLVVFGDQRPHHRIAIQAARQLALRVQVFEEGYLRPHWITLEPDGVNGCSQLPKDPDWFVEAAARLGPPPPAQHSLSPFRVRATHDVLYHLAGLSNPLLFPGYRGHAPVSAPREYAGYLRQLTRKRLERASEAHRLRAFLGHPGPYFVLLLQLDSDAQIRCHSDYPDMVRVLREVLLSFAQFAPPDARLLVKNHPLDPGLSGLRRHTQNMAREWQIDHRLLFIEGGDLNHLLPAAQGAITVNSTSGFVALENNCPLLSLGNAIYNLPGLTLSRRRVPADFWHAPPRPDGKLFQALKTTLLHTVQLNGSFYCRPGIALAVHHSTRRLCTERSRLEELLSCVPCAA